MIPHQHAVDLHVGARLRERRTALGVSQGKLGKALGLTFSQIQKYENGANRIGAGQLYRIGMLLGVEPSWFFAGLDGRPEPLVRPYVNPKITKALNALIQEIPRR